MKTSPLGVALALALAMTPGCGAASPQCPESPSTTAAPAPAESAPVADAAPEQPQPAAPPRGAHPLLSGTLYSNTAAEYQAVTRAVYRAAQTGLDGLVRNKRVSAALEQKGAFARLPPAVILDIDETVLDNSPYQARLIQSGESYPNGWAEWCGEAKAKAVPGALEFTKYAASRGVTVFYVTNRKANLEEATRKNLKALGFPLVEKQDVVLLRDEQEGWSRDKTSRREVVAKTHRIVALVGDALGDFLQDEKASSSERSGSVSSQAARWGSSWFMLPNAMYGNWDAVTFGHDHKLSPEKKGKLRVQALDTAR